MTEVPVVAALQPAATGNEPAVSDLQLYLCPRVMLRRIRSLVVMEVGEGGCDWYLRPDVVHVVAPVPVAVRSCTVAALATRARVVEYNVSKDVKHNDD